MKETTLLQQIALGDEASLEALHRLYYPRLVRFLYRLTGDSEQIVEIVNDVFFIVWRNAKQFRGDSSVSTWILGIAYKKGLQTLSRQKPLPPDPRDVDTVLEPGVDDWLGERSNTQLLQLLSPHHRAVMELCYYFGYSYKEISEIINCPENTVKTRMYYGRRHLRSLLEDTQHV